MFKVGQWSFYVFVSYFDITSTITGYCLNRNGGSKFLSLSVNLIEANSFFIQKEISTLEHNLEECQTENNQIKEINMDLKARLESTESRLVNVLKSAPKNDKNGDNFSQDIDTILKLSSRLQEMNNNNKSLKEENETLKEVCSSLFFFLYNLWWTNVSSKTFC